MGRPIRVCGTAFRWIDEHELPGADRRHAACRAHPGTSTELLAVDRANEHYNTRAAGETGVCPRVLYHLPEHNVMVLEFIRGETMSIAKLQRPGSPTRIAQSLRKLHAGPRFRNDFNMFRLIEFYLTIVDQHSVRIPQNYREYLPRVARIEAALRTPPAAPRCRATTICWPATTSTTGSSCG